MNWGGAIVLAVTLAGIAPVHAQPYPTRTIRLIVPFAAGSTGDLIARFVQPQLAQALGQPVVIDNRAGAAGNLAPELAAKSPPDGYTMLMGTVAQSVSMTLYSRPGYDLVKDFSPVSLLAGGSYLLVVHPSMPVKSAKELIAFAKKRPGEINVATGGATIRLAAKLLDSMAGTRMTEINYKGSPQLTTGVMSGEAHVAFPPTSVALPQVRAGKLRAIAVTTPKRASIAADIPALAESLPGYDVTAWYGLMVPAGTSKEIIARLHSATVTALGQSEVKERFATTDLEPGASTPEQFGALVRTEIAKWAKVIRESGLRAD